MSKFIYFTEEEIEQASQVDLVALLRDQHEKLKKSGSEFEWRDGYAKVTVRGNEWYHQYEEIGGDTISFVQRFYNKSFPEAVEYLLGGNRAIVPMTKSGKQQKEKAEFELPPRNDNMRRVYAHKRSIGQNSTYKGNATGVTPEYSFHWHGTGENLYLFEAPIDMLSCITMHKDGWRKQSYAACCGVADMVMFQMMEDNPNIKKVYLCLDIKRK